ncbi:MAG: thioredoxin family protein [Fimbriimonadaceae bacterium]|nr:thioredoxin family protein [Chthonomonadaceae bacterium]MCO5295374.1 thioredoxin family protein [Fimbriimonadaceae bacterium]
MLWNSLRTHLALLALVLVPALAGAQDAPKVELKLSKAKAAPGAEVKGTVVITFAPGLHGYQNPPSQDYQLPVVVKGDAGTVFSSVKYPAGHDEEVGGERAKVYSGRTEVQVVFKAPAKVGAAKVSVAVDYQQCDANNCFAPGTVKASAPFTVEVTEVAAPPKGGDTPPKGSSLGQPDKPPVSDTAPVKTDPDTATVGSAPTPPPVQPADPDQTSGNDPVAPPAGSVTAPQPSPPQEDLAAAQAPEPVTEGGLAGLLQQSFRNKNYVILFGLLLLIGLAVNLTPCVYPLIPVTIGFFSNQAGDSKAARLQLGLMYMLGIALTYGLTGGIAAAAGASFGALFTQTWFLVFLGALMIVLALSMFDLYQLTLPPFVTKHLRGRSGPVGALIMGLLVGVAAAPCAGPLIAAVFTEAAKLRDTTLAVLMFTTVGLGIGIPYLVLGTATSGAKALPKAGGWMKTVKVLLGLIVIGVGLNYLMQAFERNLQPEAVTWIWVAFYVGSAVYLFAFDRESPTRFILGLKGAAILGFGLLGGMAWQEGVHSAMQAELSRLGGGGSLSEIQWQPFTFEAFEQAKKQNKVIVVDGSANWCAECKVIEKNVFEKPEAIQAMKDVIALRIDWSTGVDPEYQKQTQKMFDIVGLPHIVFHKPGGERSEIKTHLSNAQELKDALRRAGAGI